jgi:ligand-binding sensor domain-containing protein
MMTLNKNITNYMWLVLVIFSWPLYGQPFNTFSDIRFNRIGTAQGLSQSSALSLCQDKLGFIWIGTKDGLNRYDGYSFEVFKNNPLNPHSLSNNEITVIQTDPKGNLLIGTRGGGLNIYVYNQNKFVQGNSGIPSNTAIGAIYFENDSTVWVGTTDGLFRGTATDTIAFGYKFTNMVQKSIYREVSGQIMPHTKKQISILSIYKLFDGHFVVGTEKGAFLFTEDDLVFQLLNIGRVNDEKVVSILHTRQNEFVFGHWNGVTITRYQNNNFSIVSEYSMDQPLAQRLNNNSVNALASDPYGNLWGGTRNGGIFRIDSTYQLKLFKSNVYDIGMTDHIINALLIDKTGVLWIGTESRGCYQLDLNRKKFKHFDTPAEKITLTIIWLRPLPAIKKTPYLLEPR